MSNSKGQTQETTGANWGNTWEEPWGGKWFVASLMVLAPISVPMFLVFGLVSLLFQDLAGHETLEISPNVGWGSIVATVITILVLLAIFIP